jgi:hypothetical protein
VHFTSCMRGTRQDGRVAHAPHVQRAGKPQKDVPGPWHWSPTHVVVCVCGWVGGCMGGWVWVGGWVDVWVGGFCVFECCVCIACAVTRRCVGTQRSCMFCAPDPGALSRGRVRVRVRVRGCVCVRVCASVRMCARVRDESMRCIPVCVRACVSARACALSRCAAFLSVPWVCPGSDLHALDGSMRIVRRLRDHRPGNAYGWGEKEGPPRPPLKSMYLHPIANVNHSSPYVLRF